MLAPTVKLVSWLTSRKGAKPAGVEAAAGEEEVAWVHCAVGLEVEEGEGSEGEEGEGKEVSPRRAHPFARVSESVLVGVDSVLGCLFSCLVDQVEQVVQLRGFDTLRSTAGLSEADVMQMRREFHGLGEEDERESSFDSTTCLD